MDIRNFLKKAPAARRSGRASAAPPPPPKPTPVEVVDESDEDMQPRRRRRAARKRAPSDAVVDVDAEAGAEVYADAEAVDPVPAVAAARPASKRARNAGAGFGGGDGGGDGGRGEEGAAPAAKKKRWVPRTDAPPNHGAKELPVGRADCLAGMVFVITGVLDSLLREECADLCKEYGGRVVGSVSKKVTHGIVGTEPGESKMGKLKANGVQLLDEDGLFAIIRESGDGKEGGDTMEVEEVEEVAEIQPKAKGKQRASGKRAAAAAAKKEHVDEKTKPRAKARAGTDREARTAEGGAGSLWVDKYKPIKSSELVANNKAIKDLRTWLESWKDKFLRGGAHSWKLRERSDMDYAAALLVGPPGIGKTTAAHIVCKELGFEPHEFNASDVRNKGGVHMLSQTIMVANTMSRYMKIRTPALEAGGGGAAGKVERTFPEGQVLIMDEVDGMSGGDRGGSQELIKMIKTSRVPIVCIANDDSTPNMRSLGGNCFKIRFRRPMVTQVTKRLAEVARKEGFRQLQDQTLSKLAEGCNGDIRQMINMLQTWRTASPSLSFGQVKERLQVEGKTVMQKSIFELAKGFFTPGIDGSQNSLIARTDNFFADSDMMPLFIQENYVNTGAAHGSLAHLADAAESISEGDLCNSLIRREQRWELMPSAAILSSIRPGSILAGGLQQQPQFPAFLGNMSKGNKWKRIVQGLEMKVKAVQTTSGSVRAFRLDYVPALTTCLATPLIQGGAAGIEDVVERLDAYYLQRDPDWLELLEAGVYAKGRSPLENIKGPVKTGLTRAYNARTHRRSTVTGARVGVKQKGGEALVSRAGARAAEDGGDVGVVDDDPLDAEEPDRAADQEEGVEDVEDVVAQFGKKKTGRAKAGTGGKGGAARGAKGARGKAAAGRGRGKGRGRGRKRA